MKIVKAHKNRSKHSEGFGIWSGKTLSEVSIANSGISHGGCSDMIDYIRFGTNEAFMWIDDMEEARMLGEKLIQLAEEAERRRNLK